MAVVRICLSGLSQPRTQAAKTLIKHTVSSLAALSRISLHMTNPPVQPALTLPRSTPAAGTTITRPRFGPAAGSGRSQPPDPAPSRPHLSRPRPRSRLTPKGRLSWCRPFTFHIVRSARKRQASRTRSHTTPARRSRASGTDRTPRGPSWHRTCSARCSASGCSRP